MDAGFRVQSNGGECVFARKLVLAACCKLLIWSREVVLSVGWLFLRNLGSAVLALLLASGAGGMLYLIVTSLVPQAEERQYQQSAAISIAAGFAAILVLSQLQ